jgi:hypothetical protein
VDEQSIQANAQQNYLAQPAVPAPAATVPAEPAAVEGEPRRLS